MIDIRPLETFEAVVDPNKARVREAIKLDVHINICITPAPPLVN